MLLRSKRSDYHGDTESRRKAENLLTGLQDKIRLSGLLNFQSILLSHPKDFSITPCLRASVVKALMLYFTTRTGQDAWLITRFVVLPMIALFTPFHP